MTTPGDIRQGFPFHPEMIALLEARNITGPTPLQQEIIPSILEGRDVYAESPPGSGKTWGYLLPVVERVRRDTTLRTLVVCTTREMAATIADEFHYLLQGTECIILRVCGGVDDGYIHEESGRAAIIVATPRRLADVLKGGIVDLGRVSLVVLEDADQLFDTGLGVFLGDIISSASNQQHMVILSGSYTEKTRTLARKYLRNPKHIEMPADITPDAYHQTYFQIDDEHKFRLLLHLMKGRTDRAFVYCNQKDTAIRSAQRLRMRGIPAQVLVGGMFENARNRIIRKFRAKEFNILVATDFAGTDLDVDDVSLVYNYDLPPDARTYRNRLRRIRGAEAPREVISFVSYGKQRMYFQNIQTGFKGEFIRKSLKETGFAISAPGRSGTGHTPHYSTDTNTTGALPDHQTGVITNLSNTDIAMQKRQERLKKAGSTASITYRPRKHADGGAQALKRRKRKYYDPE